MISTGWNGIDREIDVATFVFSGTSERSGEVSETLDEKRAPRPPASLRSLLASSPCLVALTSWFRAVRIPPQCRNRLLAIVSNLFYRTRHSQHSTYRRIQIARCPTAQGRMSNSPLSRINIAISVGDLGTALRRMAIRFFAAEDLTIWIRLYCECLL